MSRERPQRYYSSDDCKCCIWICSPCLSLWLCLEYTLKGICCCPCYMDIYCCDKNKNNKNITPVNNENITSKPDNNIVLNDIDYNNKFDDIKI